jgi:PAS domain S-box-containing protein
MKDASASDLWLQAAGDLPRNTTQRSSVRRLAIVLCCALIPAVVFLLLASTSVIDRIYHWTVELQGWRTVELIVVLASTLVVIATLHWWEVIASMFGAGGDGGEMREVNRDRLLNVLADAMDDVLTLSTVDGRVLYVSPSAAQFFGHRGGEVLHAGFLTRVHPGDHDALMDAHRRTVAGDVTRAEWRMRMPDGEYVWCETVSVPVRSRGGAIELIAGCTRNVAARKRAEAEALLAGAFFDGVEQELGDPIGYAAQVIADESEDSPLSDTTAQLDVEFEHAARQS